MLTQTLSEGALSRSQGRAVPQSWQSAQLACNLCILWRMSRPVTLPALLTPRLQRKIGEGLPCNSQFPREVAPSRSSVADCTRRSELLLPAHCVQSASNCTFQDRLRTPHVCMASCVRHSGSLVVQTRAESLVSATPHWQRWSSHGYLLSYVSSRSSSRSPVSAS
eukprot:3901570-Rhodomonas_salina.1